MESYCRDESDVMASIKSIVSENTLESAKSSLSVCDLILCVIIRGSISREVFKVWNEKLPSALAKSEGIKVGHIKIYEYFVDDCTHIIADEKVTMDNFLMWSYLTTWTSDLSSKCYIVKPNFVFDIIKTKTFMFGTPTDMYMHSLHKPIEVCDNLVIADTLKNSTLEKSEKVAWRLNKESFACVISGTNEATTEEKNPVIARIFNQLFSIYEALGDEFRAKSYRQGELVVTKLPTFENVLHFREILKQYNISSSRGLGKSLCEKIEEILKTGKLIKLEGFNSDEKVQSLLTFKKIWGVGFHTARKLYDLGFKTISDLRNRGTMHLNDRQNIGLSLYEDLIKRMPREEVDEIFNVVKSAAETLVPGVNVTIAGSYRRGKLDCGDIDILLSPPDGVETLNVHIVKEVVNCLSQSGFLTHHLAMPDEESIYFSGGKKRQMRGKSEPVLRDNYNLYGVSTYMGVCKLPVSSNCESRVHRRIDIKYYPKELIGTALLYFTGSDHFNRSMRQYAKLKGYSLSDRGLIKKTTEGEKLIKCCSEKDVFMELGLPFKEPHERNCFDTNSIMQLNESNSGSRLLEDLDDDDED